MRVVEIGPKETEREIEVVPLEEPLPAPAPEPTVEPEPVPGVAEGDPVFGRVTAASPPLLAASA